MDDSHGNRFIDLTNQRFGKWLVSFYSHSDSKGASIWNCVCDCGNIRKVFSESLRDGGSISCGCSRMEDLTNKRFGKFLVISRAENKNNKIQWNCLCDCGNKRVIPPSRLKNGTSKSCGCSRLPNMIGKEIGALTVISYSEGKWDCRCICGKIIKCKTQSLNKVNKKVLKSCGCIPKYNKLADETLAAKHLLYSSYKKGAKRRGHSFLLNFEEFINLVQQKCFYCGEEPLQCCKNKYAKDFYYNGLDRVDNSKGYFLENVKVSCFKCNNAKQKRSKDDFIAWVKRCYDHLNLK